MRMQGSQRVLVYEYLTAGGYPGVSLAGGIAYEALAMLWAVLADFRAWGSVYTVTALDPRFERCIPGLDRHTLPANEVVVSTEKDSREIFLSLLERCDAALIVAPETDRILSGLSVLVEDSGRMLLGSGSGAVSRAGDKAVCEEILSGAGLPVPGSRIFKLDALDGIMAEDGRPFVLKPVDGVGSEGVCLVAEAGDIPGAVARIRKATSAETALWQPFIDGIHASVSLLAAKGRSVPISLNRQLVHPGNPFRYYGNVVPLQHAMARRAMETACAAANCIEGLRGYVGVDLVLGDDALVLIEINPRLTTSYIGIRQLTDVNLGRLIFEACVDGKLPDGVSLEGTASVIKEDPGSWGFRAGT
jgi:predicted ATP-grasp superfamily ATP-dependent carboligase